MELEEKLAIILDCMKGNGLLVLSMDMAFGYKTMVQYMKDSGLKATDMDKANYYSQTVQNRRGDSSSISLYPGCLKNKLQNCRRRFQLLTFILEEMLKKISLSSLLRA